jgi:hypothetical protein
MDLENMKVWMAEGNAPIHLRQFREYDLARIFSGRLEGGSETVSGFDFRDEKNRLAKESYILSFIAAFNGDYSTAKTHIEASMEHRFWPEMGLVSAIISLKEGEFQKGLELLTASKTFIEERKGSLGIGHFPPEYFEICFYLARTLDLMGRRGDALKEYAYVEGHADLEDINIRNKAKQAGPYHRKRLKKILMPYSSYIPFD